MFWSRKKQIISDEYADCLNKILKLGNDVSLLRAEMEKNTTLVNSLRGLVNRKIKINDGLGDEEDKPMDPTEVQRALLGLR